MKIGLNPCTHRRPKRFCNQLWYRRGFAKAIANISENNDVKLYADDVIAESDNSFASGIITIGIDDLYDAAKVALLDYVAGDTVDATTGAKEHPAPPPL